MGDETDSGKKTAELLKAALAAKKAGRSRHGGAAPRPDSAGAKVQKDAARRAGKSRKVH